MVLINGGCTHTHRQANHNPNSVDGKCDDNTRRPIMVENSRTRRRENHNALLFYGKAFLMNGDNSRRHE